MARDYVRHWTPIHCDVVVDDLDLALARALDAGAAQEGVIREARGAASSRSPIRLATAGACCSSGAAVTMRSPRMITKPKRKKARGRSRNTARAPIEVEARPGLPLGMPAAVFLRDYWQKRPLLIRGAFPDFETPVQPEDLAGLACEETALSRLITHDRATDAGACAPARSRKTNSPACPTTTGPCSSRTSTSGTPTSAPSSTLQFPAALAHGRCDDQLRRHRRLGRRPRRPVRRLPAAGLRPPPLADRCQATKGKRPPLDFRDDVELKLLRRFKPTHDWVLGPGDMLYLPPGVPHHGVAEDACLTFSFGMRAPASAELISDYLDTLIEGADESIRYQDPDLKLPEGPERNRRARHEPRGRGAQCHPHERPGQARRLVRPFHHHLPRRRRSDGAAPLPREEIEPPALGAGLQRHPWARLAWRRAKRGASLYCQRPGVCPAGQGLRSSWRRGRDRRRGYAGLSQAGRDAVFALLGEGHYRLAMPGDDEA